MSLPNQANDQENYTDANGVAKYADPLSLYKNPEPVAHNPLRDSKICHSFISSDTTSE